MCLTGISKCRYSSRCKRDIGHFEDYKSTNSNVVLSVWAFDVLLLLYSSRNVIEKELSRRITMETYDVRSTF